MRETAKIEQVDRYPNKTVLLIYLLESLIELSLNTGIPHKKGITECKLKEEDVVKALVLEGQKTKIDSTACEDCPFGGKLPQNPTISCNIYTRI